MKWWQSMKIYSCLTLWTSTNWSIHIKTRYWEPTYTVIFSNSSQNYWMNLSWRWIKFLKPPRIKVSTYSSFLIRKLKNFFQVVLASPYLILWHTWLQESAIAWFLAKSYVATKTSSKGSWGSQKRPHSWLLSSSGVLWHSGRERSHQFQFLVFKHLTRVVYFVLSFILGGKKAPLKIMMPFLQRYMKIRETLAEKPVIKHFHLNRVQILKRYSKALVAEYMIQSAPPEETIKGLAIRLLNINFGSIHTSCGPLSFTRCFRTNRPPFLEQSLLPRPSSKSLYCRTKMSRVYERRLKKPWS